MFSVNVLLYGDYPALAYRVLQPLRTAPAELVKDLRIGLNAVSPKVKDIVFDFCGRDFLRAPCYVYETEHNVGKYPLMRRMFKDSKRPLADHIMWFDDDSYLGRSVGSGWWYAVMATLSGSNLGMLGVVHYIRPRGNQLLGMRQQPWYTGKPLHNDQFKFITGGWWAGRSDFILQHDYPFEELHHNGGDSILGALCQQQDIRIETFADTICHCQSDGCVRKAAMLGDGHSMVHINHAERRGLGSRRQDEVYIWQGYQPGMVDFSHHMLHNFQCKVYSFRTPQLEIM